MLSKINPGDSANLLLGLDACWYDVSSDNCPFRQAEQIAFKANDESLNNGAVQKNARWGDLSLTTHDDLPDLVNELFDYSVLPFSPQTKNFSVPTSALMLCDPLYEENTSRLCEYIGVDKAHHQEFGYVLIKVKRQDQSHDFQGLEGGIARRIKIEDHWQREGLRAVGRLRVKEKINRAGCLDAIVSARQAERYLDYFYNFGTHLVSSVTQGDIIFQVFSYPLPRFAQLKNKMLADFGQLHLSGLSVLSFHSLLTIDWDVNYGHIRSAANDGLLQGSIGDGHWYEHALLKKNILLTPFLNFQAESTALTVLEPFTASTAIAIKFSPQNKLMTQFRACAWDRLLKAAFFQSFGNAIQMPCTPIFAKQEHSLLGYQAKYLNSKQSTFTSMVNDLDIITVREEYKLLLLNNNYCAIRIEIDADKTIKLVNDKLDICCYQLMVKNQSKSLPVISVSDTAFASKKMLIATMQGGFFLQNHTGDRRLTVFEGMQLGDGEQYKHSCFKKVVIDDDLQAPKPDFIRQNVTSIYALYQLSKIIQLAPSLYPIEDVSLSVDYIDWITPHLAQLMQLLIDDDHLDVFQQSRCDFLEEIKDGRIYAPIDSNILQGCINELLQLMTDIKQAEVQGIMLSKTLHNIDSQGIRLITQTEQLKESFKAIDDRLTKLLALLSIESFKDNALLQAMADSSMVLEDNIGFLRPAILMKMTAFYLRMSKPIVESVTNVAQQNLSCLVSLADVIMQQLTPSLSCRKKQ
ncbi:MAG: hypothetical protein ACJAXJ_003765 [Colwellia sp.]|jgi:hypothetical protein